MTNPSYPSYQTLASASANRAVSPTPHLVHDVALHPCKPQQACRWLLLIVWDLQVDLWTVGVAKCMGPCYLVLYNLKNDIACGCCCRYCARGSD